MSSYGRTLSNVDEPARNATAGPRPCPWRQRCVPNARFSFDGPTHRTSSVFTICMGMSPSGAETSTLAPFTRYPRPPVRTPCRHRGIPGSPLQPSAGCAAVVSSQQRAERPLGPPPVRLRVAPQLAVRLPPRLLAAAVTSTGDSNEKGFLVLSNVVHWFSHGHREPLKGKKTGLKRGTMHSNTL